jgi:hypothetical protein
LLVLLFCRLLVNHVSPGFVRRVTTICVLFGTLFQERVSYFTVYILMLSNTTIIKY